MKALELIFHELIICKVELQITLLRDAATETAKLSLEKVIVDTLLEIARINLVAHTEAVDQLVYLIIARVENIDLFPKS